MFRRMEAVMKIYLLILIMSAITLMSYYAPARSQRQVADPR